jgi:hypothetical protein
MGFRQATRDRLGSDPHRKGLGSADGAPRVHQYVAQGGDWGNAVTEQLAVLKPKDCWAFTPTCQPPCRLRSRRRSPPAVPCLTVFSAEEEKAYEILKHFFATGVGYANEMANRPQTLVRHRGLAGRSGGLDARS